MLTETVFDLTREFLVDCLGIYPAFFPTFLSYFDQACQELAEINANVDIFEIFSKWMSLCEVLDTPR